MSAESLACVRWLLDHDLIDVEKAKIDGVIHGDAINVDQALATSFSWSKLPFDAEKVIAIVDHHLVRQKDQQEREKLRKILLRWLQHPELGAHPEGARPMPKWDDPRPMPQVDSPLCWCGDRFKQHDEEGQCRNCHCTQYGRAR